MHDLPAYTLNYGDLASSTSTSTSTGAGGGRARTTSGEATARPEKTTQTAARMIAGALGVRAPKRTEEQRKYDKAVRENERKRREREREEEVEKERRREEARRGVWEDG